MFPNDNLEEIIVPHREELYLFAYFVCKGWCCFQGELSTFWVQSLSSPDLLSTTAIRKKPLPRLLLKINQPVLFSQWLYHGQGGILSSGFPPLTVRVVGHNQSISENKRFFFIQLDRIELIYCQYYPAIWVVISNTLLLW